jgi:ribonuclease E
MNNKMLLSVAGNNELRIAIIKNSILNDLYLDHLDSESKKGNIYKAKIVRIKPDLDAVFVNYGADKDGFLPFKEIAPVYLPGYPQDGAVNNINIKDFLREGMELIVQVEKEERGSKGAALTTFISLAGSYVVLMPNNPRAGGISRRIEGEERDTMRDVIKSLKFPEDMGIIVRTAGIGKSIAELQWDLDHLLQQWDTIYRTSQENAAPFLIYQEADSVIKATRDYLRQDINEIIVDNRETFEKVRKYIQNIKPELYDRIQFYEEKIPLFSFYEIEKQIEVAYQRTVHLPSGGSIVIDHTEALVSIDVNSAKAAGGSDIEETALNTNLEAVKEISRQLRLRDIGGLIVIDFIDMTSVRNQREVSDQLRNALQCDRARVQVGNISRFGLLEMSRQRLRPHISEAIQVPCPRCDGQGTIRSVDSMSASIIRIIEEEAAKNKTAQIQAQVPVDIATFLINEKRQTIAEIEKRQEVKILILPNPYLESPNYKVKKLRDFETGQKYQDASHKIVSVPELEVLESAISQPKTVERAAIRASMIPEQPAPVHTRGKIFAGLKRFFSGLFTAKPKAKKEPEKFRDNRYRDRDRGFSGHRDKRRPHHQQRRSGGFQPRRDRDERAGDRRERDERGGDRRPPRNRPFSDRGGKPRSGPGSDNKFSSMPRKPSPGSSNPFQDSPFEVRKEE